MNRDALRMLAVTLLLLGAMALVVTPAAATGDGVRVGTTGDGVDVASADDGNSTVDVGATVETAGGGGSGGMVCHGQPTHHDCDKDGELHGEPGSVDYTGETYSDDEDARFGGGDQFVVEGAGEHLLVGFYCAFTTSPSPETCDVDVGSSQGDAPGPLAPDGNEFADGDGSGDAPGDQRSDRGESNGQDDGTRNESARGS